MRKLRSWKSNAGPKPQNLDGTSSCALVRSLHPCSVKSESPVPSLDSVGSCRSLIFPSSRVLSFVSSASPNWLPFPHFLYSRSHSEPSVSALLAALMVLPSFYSFSVPESRSAVHLTLSAPVPAVPSLQRGTSRCSANICCTLWANVPRWRPGGLRCWGVRVIWWISRSARIPKRTSSRHALDPTAYKATQKAVEENRERALCDLLTAPGQGEEKSNGMGCWIRLVLGHICANSLASIAQCSQPSCSGVFLQTPSWAECFRRSRKSAQYHRTDGSVYTARTPPQERAWGNLFVLSPQRATGP